MPDLDIRVKATDLASNVLANVGDNVAVIGKQASQTLDSISKSASEQAQSVGSSTTIITGGGGLGLIAKTLTSVAGATVAAIGGVVAFGAAAIGAANKAEKELAKVGDKFKLIEAQRLNIPINVVGDDSIDAFKAKVQGVAAQLEKITGQSSNKFTGLGVDALMGGIDPGQVDQAMQAAAGLSYAFGTSLEGGMSKARAAIEGNFGAFEALIPGIQNLATNEEKLAAVSKLASDAMIMQSESVGILTQLGNGFGNLLERVGSGQSVVTTLAGVLGDILVPAIDFVDEKIVSLGGAADFLKESLATAFAFVSATVETVWNDIGLILERGKLSFLLFAESSILSIEHAFTVQMPAYVVWFTDNFFNLLQDLATGAITIVSNLGKNIADAFGAYWHYITEGWSQGESLSDLATNIGNIATRNLLDGFEPVTSELPKIADRAMSNVEKDLTQQMKGIDDKLGQDFGKAFDRSMSKMKSTLADTQKEVEVDLKLKPPNPDLLNVNQKIESKQNTAIESRVMVRGPSDDPMQKQLALQAKQVELLQQLAAQKQAADAAARMMQASNTGLTVQIVGN